MYLYNFKQLYELISKRSLMKCIGLMGLTITKSISSSQFSHHSFWKKALNKPHGNYPKLERDSQKRLIFVTHVYFYHDNIHCSYLKSLKKKFPKHVPSSCYVRINTLTTWKFKPIINRHSWKPYPFIFPPSTGTSFNAMIREQTVGGKIYNQICHPPQNYLIFSPQYHQNTNRLDPMQWS